MLLKVSVAFAKTVLLLAAISEVDVEEVSRTWLGRMYFGNSNR